MKNLKDIRGILKFKSFLIVSAIIFLILSLALMVISCSQASEAIDLGQISPYNLQINGFTGTGQDRSVDLSWELPDSELNIINFIIYMDGEEFAETTDTEYQAIIGNNDHEFYVTAVYDSDIESLPSNIVNTKSPEAMDMPSVGPGNGDSRIKNDSDEENDPDNDGDELSKDLDLEDLLSGPCANVYYPVVLGISHTYKSSGGTTTSTITDIYDTGFTVTHTIAGSTQTHEWECLPEGLIDLSNPMGEAINIIGGGETVTGSTSVTGVTIPSSIDIGDSWSQTYDGTLDVQGYPTGLDFSATVIYNAVSEEEITIGLGTFKALRVETSMDSSYAVRGPSGAMPLYNYNATGVSWWVKNIGPVKTMSEGHIEGATELVPLSHDFSDTTELIDFSVPSQ